MPDPRALLLDAVGTLIELREPPLEVYLRAAQAHGIAADPRDVGPRLRDALGGLPAPVCEALDAEDRRRCEREGWRDVVRKALGDEAADGPCFDALFDGYAEAAAWRCNVSKPANRQFY